MQDFLLAVTFRASGGVALFAFQSASHTRSFVRKHGRKARYLAPAQGGRGFSFIFFARVQMTGRIICIFAVAIAIGPSLAYGSPACMTESEARAKFPKATHLYMRKNCWSDSATNTVQARSVAAMPVHSPQPKARAAVPAPSPRPARAAAPVLPSRHKIVNSGIDAGAQCQYSPCE